MQQKTTMEELAIERTLLAQERTNLSYIRTGMSMVLGGLFFTGYFAAGSAYFYIGYVIIVIAVVFTIYGFYYHRKSREFVNQIIGIPLGTKGRKKMR